NRFCRRNQLFHVLIHAYIIAYSYMFYQLFLLLFLKKVNAEAVPKKFFSLTKCAETGIIPFA
ncbi:MAG: hypothetical protein LBQ33_04080, partial [Oscillospiraceae bacterium]|nr:hypothetical protein [Oscillospiraceae bacterium]